MPKHIFVATTIENWEKVFHSIVGASWKAAVLLAPLSLLVAPWAPKLGGAEGAAFKVTLGPGDSGLGAISSNGDCGTSGWPQLFTRFDNGCFVGVLGLVSANISVQKKGGEVNAVTLFFRNGAGDLYQTDRLPVSSAGTPVTSACFIIHVHDSSRQVYKGENPDKGKPLVNIALGDVGYCPNP